jgi:hypothetical protein
LLYNTLLLLNISSNLNSGSFSWFSFRLCWGILLFFKSLSLWLSNSTSWLWVSSSSHCWLRIWLV